MMGRMMTNDWTNGWKGRPDGKDDRTPPQANKTNDIIY
jgi:hypothetical protein